MTNDESSGLDRIEMSLEARIKACKRRYRKSLLDVAAMIQSELEHMDDEVFDPSPALESGAFHMIQESNRLKSLLELEK